MKNHTLPPDVDPVLTLAQVRAAVSYSPSSVWRMIKAGTFPRPVRLGPGRVGWRQSAVAEWLDARELQSKGECAAIHPFERPRHDCLS